MVHTVEKAMSERKRNRSLIGIKSIGPTSRTVAYYETVIVSVVTLI